MIRQLHTAKVPRSSIPLRIHQILVSREVGGAAEIALRLGANSQTDIDCCSSIWLPGEGRAWLRAAELHLDVQRYNADNILSNSWFRAAASNARFASRLKSLGGGMIHVHAPFLYGALRHGFALSRAPTIAHVHLEYRTEALAWAFRSPPNVIVTCAAFLERQVREALPMQHRDNQQIVVVRNCVDKTHYYPSARRAAKAKVGAPLDRPMLLMLANLAPHKGQTTAVRALAELKRRGVSACCWLAGVDRQEGEPFSSQLKQLIAELCISDDVRLLGYRGDGADLLRAADFLLLPSTSEGLPLTVLEAQATKVPVLAAPTAGVPEVIRDGETGFLLAAEDYQGYASRLYQLIENARLAEHVAEKAFTNCTNNFTWQNYWEQMSNVYRQLLNVSAGKRRRSGRRWGM